MICTLCETSLKNKIDDSFFECKICNALVKDCQFYLTRQQEKERYESHNNDVNDVRYQQFTSPITKFILKNYTQNHFGLDFGCGTGPVISKQLQNNGFRVQLFDVFFYPDENYLNFQYDYIICCEVFEHFFYPKQEIEKLLRLLKTDGRLLIMTHQFDRLIDFPNWYYRKDPTHVFIFTSKTFQFIAEKYHLTIENHTNRFVILKK
ncbi:MAG: class I SAM-dependent methyltransferase [Flavobacteriia bacterium]|nr:class I SAM-dependent methyltransferase [Flavobacteriia bacterium]OIP48310.1 MAG: 2-polyprenyl-3-methyl-5-hydroxy-6-metoxy-1,4-benzoquinol methylase [Flavobacteriaceae bacterium CG2_30_31_66]PIV95395.1 MAG: 2-polyprenyl-3-methyl-5-hydroxy-6-metoxy-1,4-benzoquinol methylase [Flavobacteriaceae bacterium CG17_big_fil_post_rev_8_21_14_2_50_31_13]PIX12873.1 MAG: 2-polyprenyl-3-methyl-5-hydroxy-6-metoxy-1,4-benzoquinol methylase [Flavobacteriaceae bacterium CG_4_8_14_3_um_filter_31_8]PIY13759.1 MA